MQSDCVSVIIPTYNRARIIKRSIDSVLKQTYSNLEIIVVDDNSSDNTKEVIDSISDSRIRYIRLNHNYGACYARNVGVKSSIGKFIAFQDSDDEWLRMKIERQLNYLKKRNLDLVSCKMNRIFENHVTLIFPNNISINNKNIYYENKISTQTMLGRRTCFEDEKFDESLPRFQDWELILRMFKKYKIQIMDEVLVNTYIQTKNNISGDSAKAIMAIKIMIDKVKTNRKAKSSLFKTLAYFEMLDGKHYRGDLFKALKGDPLNKRILINCLFSLMPNILQKRIRKHFAKV